MASYYAGIATAPLTAMAPTAVPSQTMYSNAMLATVGPWKPLDALGSAVVERQIHLSSSFKMLNKFFNISLPCRFAGGSDGKSMGDRYQFGP